MSMWISHQSLSLTLSVAAALRVVQHSASALVSPASLRRAQSGVVRLITVVAGH